MKRYLAEPDSGQGVTLLDADPDWVTSAVIEVEVRRVLAARLGRDTATVARRSFLRDWERMAIVAADPTTLGLAAALAEATGVRSLDALHLASAQRVADGSMRVLTSDVRMAAAARGLPVVGA